MRAMILAAGKGDRLRPLTATVPKPLIEVAGVPMIAFPLKLLHDAGISEVVINLHHLGDQIRATLGDGSAYGVRITYSEENPILDTGGAIFAAREFLNGDTFVVLNADTVIDLTLHDAIAFHRQRDRAIATMVVRPDPDALRNDDIGIDAECRIRRFLGRDYPPSLDGHGRPHGATGEPTGPHARLMYPGVMVFEPRLFTFMHPGIYSITRDVFPRLLAAQEGVYGYVYDGFWRVLDTPHDLEAGRRELAERTARRPE